MLYQKIRPTSFDQIIGNSTTVGGFRKLLRKSPANQPHTIVLHGPIGCGKTTLALILAEGLGGDADSTIRINAGNSKGIETAREIERELSLPSFGGKPKIYIIDESQQMLKDTQEALLNATEDTPEYIYFIWCTSAPGRLIPALRSRATEYEVEKLSRQDIVKVLEQGVVSLGVAVDADILEAIPHVCDGSPRQALVLLEKVGDIEDVDAALTMLEAGTEQDKSVLDLMNLITMNATMRAKKWQTILSVYDKIDANSERIRRSLTTYLYNKLVKEKDVSRARDFTWMLNTLATNTYYGGKSHLGALLARICLETPTNKL